MVTGILEMSKLPSLKGRERPVAVSSVTPPVKRHDEGMPTELLRFKEIVDRRLDELVPPGRGPSEAARHVLLAPGKRLRAILTMVATEEAGGDPDLSLDAACAIEMVHTASLIIDDLPAMDDAQMRRGRTTPHILFGADVAILAGIGLLNGAFGALADCATLTSEQKVAISSRLATAVGWQGLIGGQALDLASTHGQGALEEIHDGKTGVLFEAAVISGAIAAGREKDLATAYRLFARSVGRAYQAFDDILDRVADESIAGKSTGRDAGKLTAVTAEAEEIDQALAGAARHLQAAKEALPTRPDAPSRLGSLADTILRLFEAKFRHAGMAPAMS